MTEFNYRGTKLFDPSSPEYANDGLPIMPWRLLHADYQVSRQSTVVSVDPDAGIPITHSKFTVGGRIISAKIYTDTEPEFWIWYNNILNCRALPCWVYDARVKRFCKCYMIDEPALEPATVQGCYVQIKLYTKSTILSQETLVTEDTPENFVTEDSEENYVTVNREDIY